MKEPKIMLINPAMEILPEGQNMRSSLGLGPLCVAGALVEENVPVKIFDMIMGDNDELLSKSFYNHQTLPHGNIRVGISLEDMIEKIDEFKPNIIGVSSIFTEQTDMALEVAEAVKKYNKNILLIVGGGNANALKEHFLNNNFDLISSGDGELAIKALIANLRKKEDISSTLSFSYKKDGKVISNNILTYSNLNDSPFPYLDGISLPKYWNVNSAHYGAYKGGKFWQIETGRGCKFHCTYCINSFGKVIREKSIKRVLSELQVLKKKGVEDVFIEDDCIGNRPPEFWEKIKSMGLKFYIPNGINISSLIKYGSPYNQLINTMIDAGVNHLSLPFESGSTRILNKWSNLKWNPEKISISSLKALCNYLNDKGIITDGYFMIGFPDEKLEEVYKTYDLAKDLRSEGLSSATFFICTPFPGTAMWKYAKKHNLISQTNYRDFRIGKPFMETNISYDKLSEFRKEWYTELNETSYVETRSKKDVK